MTVRSDGVLRAEGPDRGGRTGWSVSFELLVPRESDLSLETNNGSIAIAEFAAISLRSTNGSITLDGVAGNVRGRTTKATALTTRYAPAEHRGENVRSHELFRIVRVMPEASIPHRKSHLIPLVDIPESHAHFSQTLHQT